MSEEREERPTPDDGAAFDADAWSTACAEDLAQEKARRRGQHGPPPGSAAEELRRLVDTVADRLTSLSSAGSPLLGAATQGAAQQMVRQVVQQAKAAVEPVIERNPDVFDHLAAAGNEILAAYRSAVQKQEERWTARAADTGASGPRPTAPPESRRDDGDDAGPGERIDLD
ncbi:DUF5304 domain-containing protein [Streptomyces sp. NPDC090306]|uniref:DUF5304 domain-containing protein n=1 Tax=unclassified Streptomyces TaxID=2593676 RepID=UPI0036EEA2BF